MLRDASPYIATAVATLAVTLLVQLWIIPQVESRKRMQDRWERDVRELFDLLVLDYRPVADTVARMWDSQWCQASAETHPEWADQFRLTRSILGSTAQAELARRQVAQSDLRNLLPRIDFLVSHIVGLRPSHRDLVRLSSDHRKMVRAAKRLSRGTHAWDAGGRESQEDRLRFYVATRDLDVPGQDVGDSGPG